MNKIQELTEQLLREGVEKGNQQAADIIAQAEAKKAEILAAAQKQADEIVASAQKQAEELDKNTKAELKLFANQALDALKSEVINLLNDKVVSGSMDKTLNEKFMPQLILTFVQNWASKGELIVETADADALSAYFKKEAADILKSGLQIKQVNGLATDFVLTAADGSYKIQLGKQDFVEYFKEFLRPKLVEMLF